MLILLVILYPFDFIGILIISALMWSMARLLCIFIQCHSVISGWMKWINFC